MILPLGTLINVVLVILGSIIGIFFKKIINPEINKKIFFALGLFTIVLGMSMAIKTTNFILMLSSVLLGTIIGEYYDWDTLINRKIDNLKNKLKIKDQNFTDGFLTAFLLYCIGSMTIVGAIEEGLGQVPSILYTKSIMDGISSIFLASTFGIGVLFSVIPMFIFQTGITLFAYYFQDYFSLELIEQISSLGGILILAIGLKILGYKYINPTNMLPSLIVVIVLQLLISNF
ncbi:MAG: hypothetical protein CMD26_05580 [Flavobacteriales bacterium]|nr:hypothetical protein [Flavobacteriales bacterium]|tara:strand:+ start:3191 stop:3883 length:693 start_codon:yes stop_codon:yes gene_type:complete